MINFLKNLFGMSLRSKVMKTVERKIAEAQKACDSEVAIAVKSYKDRQFKLRCEHIEEKGAIEDRHIRSILARIL